MCTSSLPGENENENETKSSKQINKKASNKSNGNNDKGKSDSFVVKTMEHMPPGASTFAATVATERAFGLDWMGLKW